MQEDQDAYWPGTAIRKSRGNGFTHGYLGRPHGYVPGTPANVTALPTRYKRGGFGSTNGTIPGMGNPKAFTIKQRA